MNKSTKDFIESLDEPVYKNFKKNEVYRPASVGFYWICIAVLIIYLLVGLIAPVSADGVTSCSVNGGAAINYTDVTHTVYIGDVITCTKIGSNSVGMNYYSYAALANTFANPAVFTITPASMITYPNTTQFRIRYNTEGNMWYFPYGGSPPASASFTGVPTSGTAPLTVVYSMTGAVNPLTLQYVSGDGFSDYIGASNFSHIYTMNGTYSNYVMGNYINGTPFYLFRGNYINVTGIGSFVQPDASFTMAQTNGGIVPCNVTFTDTSTGNISQWNWYVISTSGVNAIPDYFYSGKNIPKLQLNYGAFYITGLEVRTLYNGVTYTDTTEMVWSVSESGNVTPVIPSITTNQTIYPEVTYPTSIPVTQNIADKNTLFINIKNSSSVNQPDVSIQLWQYKYDWTDILHLFGTHPEQISGGKTDSNGNFMAVLDSPFNYDYKIGGNLNTSNFKSYTSEEGSFSLPPDKTLNLESNMWGFNTTLYIYSFHVLDMAMPHYPVPNVNLQLYNDQNQLTNTGLTDNNGYAMFLIIPPANVTLKMSKSGYYDNSAKEILNAASDKTYYLLQKPITTGYTTLPTITGSQIIPTYTTLPVVYNPAVCREFLDFDNETFISPFINIEACVGIVNPTYQNYILSALMMVVSGILLGKKQKNFEGFIIGVFAGMTVSAIVGLISWPVWIMLCIPIAAVYFAQKTDGSILSKGGKK